MRFLLIIKNNKRLEVKLLPASQNGQLDKNIKENGEWDIIGISAVTYLTKKEKFTISYRFFNYLF